jgi:hypothetical protein
MKKIFSWVIVLSVLLFFFGMWFMPFVDENLIPLFIVLPFILGISSGIGIIVSLVRERIKDREEEKDDLSKY